MLITVHLRTAALETTESPKSAAMLAHTKATSALVVVQQSGSPFVLFTWLLLKEFKEKDCLLFVRAAREIEERERENTFQEIRPQNPESWSL